MAKKMLNSSQPVLADSHISKGDTVGQAWNLQVRQFLQIERLWKDFENTG